MKTLICSLILAVSLTGCAVTKPTQFKPPSTVPVKQRINAVRLHVAAAKAHAGKAKAALAEAKKLAPPIPALHEALNLAGTEVDALTKELLGAQSGIAILDSKVKFLNGQIEAETKLANAQSLKLTKLQARDKKMVGRYHKLKFSVCALAAAVVLFVCLRLSFLIVAFGPWGLLTYVALPGIVFSYLWYRL